MQSAPLRRAECRVAPAGARILSFSSLSPQQALRWRRSAGELAALPLAVALERLDPLSRELILLTYYRGYTAAQAASLLNLPASTAVPRLHAALRALSPHRQAGPRLASRRPEWPTQPGAG
jgi:DNA-directed RNA polymerase specialized sigma24 family protein